MNRTFVLKQNSEAIRKKIKDAGIRVCVCATFKDSCWLDYHTLVANGVHGVGYFDDEDPAITSQADALARFEHDCKNLIECRDVDEFIKRIKERKENDYGTKGFYNRRIESRT